MKINKTLDSFNNAINGIINTVRTEKNMKIHLIISLGVLVSCFLFDITRYEFLVLAVTISMVIAAELVNTAIEAAIDMTTNYYHPLAKIAKNAAAGAVLITAINALIVGYVIFWDKLANLSYVLITKVKNSEPYTILIVLAIVCIATIIAKAIFGEGTPLKGGMPSGHSALGFSIATAISLITEEPICILLSFLLAFITAQSRVDSEVHSIIEVVVGASFGILLTLLIFTVFRL
ncbi:diacylglycerol kinase [Clostridium saccharobutylicum]|uniref:Diacylglycerol kinase n=1 Tax=Clostridium saccharobutylicum DSM 13864 TaxID=1345695 RepID=U5MR06_CLOSA|nr:diacylglycerol kinase [Clostridium saccharobutylicum]AGX42106.1 diacylglycerol kinase [Clostridium saccharobutylicum DSM 13864]AQR89383.1 undecaprenol kinase [Clostridium saccharobutylicum]AQR99285.1 undecaprenol kinase [Clostridium saccharobutylicum]AQS09017.1 undecaprenol kinase [Clostridium saccharobutylicum]AQS13271.1 undecaprenol kinase [Clostridium saccharobutylicum]